MYDVYNIYIYMMQYMFLILVYLNLWRRDGMRGWQVIRIFSYKVIGRRYHKRENQLELGPVSSHHRLRRKYIGSLSLFHALLICGWGMWRLLLLLLLLSTMWTDAVMFPESGLFTMFTLGWLNRPQKFFSSSRVRVQYADQSIQWCLMFWSGPKFI